MSAQVEQTKRRLTGSRAGVTNVTDGALSAGSQAAGAAPKDRVAVLDESARAPVTGAFSMLERVDRGIATKVRTRARPGHAHSLWFVIFNALQNCSDAVLSATSFEDVRPAERHRG